MKFSILVLTLRDKKKDHLTVLIKSASLIQKLVDKSFHFFLNNKIVTEMWIILKDRFQHISPMSIICIFFDSCNMKFLDNKDVINYTSYYQIALDKILSLINKNKDFWISKKIIKIIF